jgi:hypothetical protein
MSLQQFITYSDTNFSRTPVRTIIGGYVEFSILEETHVHYFTRADDLSELEYFVSQDKALLGLKQFIKRNYTPGNFRKQAIPDDEITIWNHEIELA